MKTSCETDTRRQSSSAISSLPVSKVSECLKTPLKQQSPHLEQKAHRSLIIVTFSFYIIYMIKHMNASQSIKEYL